MLACRRAGLIGGFLCAPPLTACGLASLQQGMEKGWIDVRCAKEGSLQSIQTVELDISLVQHGFDFQLAVLNGRCIIILQRVYLLVRRDKEKSAYLGAGDAWEGYLLLPSRLESLGVGGLMFVGGGKGKSCAQAGKFLEVGYRAKVGRC